MTTACADQLGDSLCPAAPAVDRGHCCVRIGPVDVVLDSALPDAAEDFAHLYRGWLCSAPRSGRTIHLQVRATPRRFLGGRRFAVYGDGEKLFDDLYAAEVLPYLEWGINYRLLATGPERLQLHAATMAFRQRGVLLAGGSGCGKSTLAAVLAARSWDYLCDEFALIDADSLRVHSFPKALCIKAGSFKLIERLGLPLWRRRPYVKVFKGEVGYVSPRAVNAQEGSFPVRLIVFPRYTGGGRAMAYRVSPSEAAFTLAANTFNRSVFGDRIVALLDRVVRGATCVAVEIGDIEETGALLESLLADCPTRRQG